MLSTIVQTLSIGLKNYYLENKANLIEMTHLNNPGQSHSVSHTIHKQGTVLISGLMEHVFSCETAMMFFVKGTCGMEQIILVSPEMLIDIIFMYWKQFSKF